VLATGFVEAGCRLPGDRGFIDQGGPVHHFPVARDQLAGFNPHLVTAPEPARERLLDRGRVGSRRPAEKTCNRGAATTVFGIHSRLSQVTAKGLLVSPVPARLRDSCAFFGRRPGTASG
jgi:hypothetical protein